MTETVEAAPATKRLTPTKEYYSSIDLYQHRFCRHCSQKCNPSEPRMLACILIWLGDAIHQKTEPIRESPANDDVYDKLPWESNQDKKGPFQLVSVKTVGDNELLQQLLTILKQNQHRYSEKGWNHYYWLQQDKDNIIFRRSKKAAIEGKK